MNIVKPIRDLKKIEAMKRMLHNKMDILLFTMGINTALRISDLLSLTINVRDNKGKLLQAVRLKNRKQEK